MINTCKKIALNLLPLFFTVAVSFSAEKDYSIVVIETMPVPLVLEHSRFFREYIREAAEENGMTVAVNLLKAEGNREKAERLLTEAAAGFSPDLVVSFATLATQAARAVFGPFGVPILFACVSDPVGAGIVPEVGRPSGIPVTGLVYTIARSVKLETVLRILKTGVRQAPFTFGIVHSSYLSSHSDAAMLSALTALYPEIVFKTFELPYRELSNGIDPMFDDVLEGIDALEADVEFWWEVSGPLAEQENYTAFFLEHSQKPVLFGNTLFAARAGAAVALIPDWTASAAELAGMAIDILLGTDPASIPVVPPESFSLALNLRTITALGLVVPPDLLELAGEQAFW